MVLDALSSDGRLPSAGGHPLYGALRRKTRDSYNRPNVLGVYKTVATSLDREFEEFVLGRSAALLRMAVLLVGDVHHAQDLLQVALWRTSRHWREASHHPDAYVRKALVTLTHDRRRERRRRVTEVSQASDCDPAARDDVARLVERDRLVRTLRQLPHRQRVTLVLRFWEDLSVEETAKVLKCSTGSVKSNTSHGLAKLRVLLVDGAHDASIGGTGNAY